MSSYANILSSMAAMKEGKTDPNYQKYLTEKLDRGEPNMVVDSVTELMSNDQLLQSESIRIVDFGCFTGSVINRVHLSLTESSKKKVNLFGFDYDATIVKKAALMWPQISFHQYDITETPAKIEPFQIGILSNVLHEVYSLKTNNKKEAEKLVTRSLKNIQNMIDIGGFLVILDGILPDNPEKEVDINFLQDNFYSKFIQFCKSEYCVKIPCKEVGDRTIQTTLGGLAAFLVKFRYLETTFWEQESSQIYNYFTKEKFEEVLTNCGFTVKKQDFFEVPKIQEKLKILDPTIQMPFKNTLIIAKRIN